MRFRDAEIHVTSWFHILSYPISLSPFSRSVQTQIYLFIFEKTRNMLII